MGKEYPLALLQGDKALLTWTTASFPGPVSPGSQFTGPLSCVPRMRPGASDWLTVLRGWRRGEGVER